MLEAYVADLNADTTLGKRIEEAMEIGQRHETFVSQVKEVSGWTAVLAKHTTQAKMYQMHVQGLQTDVQGSRLMSRGSRLMSRGLRLISRAPD